MRFLPLCFLFLLTACLQDDLPPPTTSLSGEWIRISSNKPMYDSMRVLVENDQGRILYLPDSTPYFQPGDLKWIDITRVSEGLYSHKELGSDGQYYPGSIRVHTNDSITLVVEPEAMGDRQVWRRL